MRAKIVLLADAVNDMEQAIRETNAEKDLVAVARLFGRLNALAEVVEGTVVTPEMEALAQVPMTRPRWGVVRCPVCKREGLADNMDEDAWLKPSHLKGCVWLRACANTRIVESHDERTTTQRR